MQQHTDFVTTRGGAAVSGASVLVKTYPAGATATIYSDDGSTEQDNPITTDADGRFSFYAADGRYTLVISKSGVITQTTLTDAVHLWDPDDGTAEQDAADVSFTPSGSGAVARTVQAKERDRYSVWDFGVTGDAVADDTAEVQAAMTAAASAGKPLHFDNADCMISTALSIPDNLHIIGSGGSLFHKAGAEFKMLLGTNTQNLIIDSLKINGNKANVTTSQDWDDRFPVIEITNTASNTIQNIRIINCEWYDFKGRGLVFLKSNSASACEGIFVNDNYVHDGESYGISVTGFNDVIISRNRVEDVSGQGITAAYNLEDVENVTISDNVVKRVTNPDVSSAQGIGITLTGPNANNFAIRNATVTGNVCVDCESMGMSLTPGHSTAAYSTSVNLTVTGNVVDGTTATGGGSGYSYEVIGGGVTFTGNVSRNPAKIHLATQRTLRSVFADNVFESTDTSTLLYGMILQTRANDTAPLKDIIVANNVFMNDTGQTHASLGMAIRLTDNTSGTATPFENIKIIGNTIEGDWPYGMYTQVSTTGLVIEDNRVVLSTTGSPGIGILANASELKISGNYVSVGNATNAIQVAAAQNLTGIYIHNNVTYSADSGYTPIRFTGASSMTSVYFSGNIARGATADVEVVGRGSLTTVVDHGDNSWNLKTAAPAAGVWSAGIFVRNSAATSAGAIAGWYCITAGTPGTWIPVGTVGYAPIVLAKSAVAASVGVVTTEATLATITVPAGVMGANGMLRVTTVWTMTNGVNDKTTRVRFSGASGTIFGGQVWTTTAAMMNQILIANRNATNSQVGSPGSTTGPFGGTGIALPTASVDTTAATTVVITGQKEVDSETLTLENYVVELIPS
jgi:hypothetical protein